MKEDYKKNLNKSKTSNPKIPDEVKQQDLQGLFHKREIQTPAYIEAKKLANEKEKFQLLGGRITSEFDEKKRLRELVSEVPIPREAKFADFFEALGKLAGWTDEQRKSWRKPKIAAKTINETIYSRFEPEVIEHIQKHNPYYRWCLRKFKNYAFLGEEGVILLEKYIYQAVIEMKNASDINDFRARLGAKYGVPYQLYMF